MGVATFICQCFSRLAERSTEHGALNLDELDHLMTSDAVMPLYIGHVNKSTILSSSYQMKNVRATRLLLYLK